MKFGTSATSILALALSATLNLNLSTITVSATAIPQFPPSDSLPSNPNIENYDYSNDYNNNNNHDSLVAIRFTIPDGRTFTETLSLDSYGYASLPIYNHNHDNRVVSGAIVHSPARFPGLVCYLLVGGLEHEVQGQVEALSLSREQHYQQLPFDLQREYGDALGLYYIGGVVYCGSRY